MISYKSTPQPFIVSWSLEFARRALSEPPASDRIERRLPPGDPVYEFVVPNRLCIRRNQDGSYPAWRKAKVRQDLYGRLSVFLMGKKRVLIEPAIIMIVRFSAVPCDANSDGEKQAIDCLCLTRWRKGKPIHGLGLLAGDSPRHVRRYSWWEPAPRGKGFTYLAVYAAE